MFTTLSKLISAVLLIAFSLSAGAAVTFEIQRVSDTSAIVTGYGSFDDASGSATWNEHILSFRDGIFDQVLPDYANESILSSSTLLVGDEPITFGYLAGPAMASGQVIYIGVENDDPFTHDALVKQNSVITGSMLWTLPSYATFADIGTVGEVIWGSGYDVALTGITVPIGSWQIVAPTAVPVPGSFLLMGSAFLGLCGLKRNATSH